MEKKQIVSFLRKKGITPMIAMLAVVLAVGGAAAALIYWTSPTFTHTISIEISSEISVLGSFDPAQIPHDPLFSWFTDNTLGFFSPHPDDQQLNFMFYGPTNIETLYVDVDLTGSYISEGDPVELKIYKVYRDMDDNEILDLIDTVTMTGGAMDAVSIPSFSDLWDHDFDGVGGTYQNYVKLTFTFDEASLINGEAPGIYEWGALATIYFGDSGI